MNRENHVLGSLQAASLYNTALTAFSALIPEAAFSHVAEHDIVFVGKKTGRGRKKGSAAREFSHYAFPARRIELIDFLIDFVRQMAGSRRFYNDFNLCQGMLFIDNFEKLFPAGETRGAMRALESLFPNIQFIIGCNTKSGIEKIASHEQAALPVASPTARVTGFVKAKSTSARKAWDYRNSFFKSRFGNTPSAGKDDVVLIDVDSQIPNLALMKLSAFYKKRGRNVILARESERCRDSGNVFASCVFNRATNGRKLRKLRSIHGENIRIGGTGVDLSLALPDEVESMAPDYSLYPGVDFALGFLTRGCPGACGFCIVPKKEGALRQVAELEDILPPGFSKLVLLDNNLLALPGVNKILEGMIRGETSVNFNQSLDIRMVNKTIANLLLKIDSRNYSFTKRMFYFSSITTGIINTGISKQWRERKRPPDRGFCQNIPGPCVDSRPRKAGCQYCPQPLYPRGFARKLDIGPVCSLGAWRGALGVKPRTLLLLRYAPRAQRPAPWD